MEEPKSKTVFQTERLNLRRLTVDDASFMLRLLNEPAFIKNIGDRNVRTLEDAESYVMKFSIASYELFGFGPYLALTKNGNEAVGICGLRQRSSFEAPDIGYALLPEHCGKGFAHEAATGLMKYARGTLGIKLIYGFVNHDNLPSIRVLEKLNFVFVKNVRLDGDTKEVGLYVSEAR